MEKIDKKDKKILYELDINSRQTLTQLGKKVGIPRSVVAYRIERLIEENIIHNFYTNINFYKLGYINLGMYAKYQYYNPEIEKKIIEHFTNSNYSWWVSNVQGFNDLLVLFLIKDLNSFFNFWKKTLNKYKYYLQETAFSFFTKTYSYPHSFILDEPNVEERINNEIINGGSIIEIDNIDICILQLITIDSRISLVEIGKKINLSATMVNKRIKKLIRVGIIQGFKIHINFPLLGYHQYRVQLNLKNYNKKSSIIKYTKNFPELVYISDVIDHCDLGFNFYFHNFDELHSYIKKIYNKFPFDIKNHTSYSFPKVFKYNFLPGDMMNIKIEDII